MTTLGIVLPDLLGVDKNTTAVFPTPTAPAVPVPAAPANGTANPSRRTAWERSTVRSRPARVPPPTTGRTCLVAVDGSEASVRALVWGLEHAIERGWCVEVLTVWPAHQSVLIHEVPGHFNAARWSAHAAQTAALRQALDRVSHEPITASRLENADAVEAIVRASTHCDLVVLGSDPNDSSHSLTDPVLQLSACDVVVIGSSSDIVITTTRSTRAAHAG